MAEGQDSTFILSLDILFGTRKALENILSIYRSMLDDDGIIPLLEVRLFDLKYTLDVIISGK